MSTGVLGLWLTKGASVKRQEGEGKGRMKKKKEEEPTFWAPWDQSEPE